MKGAMPSFARHSVVLEAILVRHPNLIEKSDAFFKPKITFGKNAKILVKYGEFSESARFRQKSRNGR